MIGRRKKKLSSAEKRADDERRIFSVLDDLGKRLERAVTTLEIKAEVSAEITEKGR